MRTGVSFVVWLLATEVAAEPRPTELRGPWSFAADDEIVHIDARDGELRVHYSIAGTNAIQPGDDDGDGVPDFAQLALTRAQESWDRFAELGFRAPLREQALGLELGGSPAFDVYLVDFDGAADGRLGIDGCDASSHCASFLVVENDFTGYAYASDTEALDTVVSHELFHAVQAAYAPLPVWASEGSAVWAERRFRPESRDFLRHCNGWLADHQRSLHRPPPGPVPAFAYGSALWWEFLASTRDDAVIVALLEAIEQRREDVEAVQVVLFDLLTERGDDPSELWWRFAQLGLATGARAGGIDGHPFADALAGIEADAAGPELDVDARLFPLAASYWRIDHPGGRLYFASDASLPDVRLSLHAAQSSDAPVGEALLQWQADGTRIELGDRDAGVYWIVASLPVLAEGSAKARVCIGAAHVEQCVAATGTTGGTESSSSGSASSGRDDGGPVATATSSDDTGNATRPAVDDGSSEGCGCAHAATSPWWLLAVLPWRARRSRG